jgi:hypothetical protein
MNTEPTAVALGVRTFLKDSLKVIAGLLTVIWAVPGVPEAVTSYLETNLLNLSVGLGIGTGVVRLVIGILNPNVKNI